MDTGKCRDIALRYLAASNKTVSEVRKYLVAQGCTDTEIAETLAFLEEFHYVDDEAYCLQYMRNALLRKRRGIAGTKRELSEKGIERNTIEDALCTFVEEENLPEERERAAHAAVTLFRTDNADDKLIAKIARKLVYMGYDKDTVYEVVGRFMRKKETEFDE